MSDYDYGNTINGLRNCPDCPRGPTLQGGDEGLRAHIEVVHNDNAGSKLVSELQKIILRRNLEVWETLKRRDGDQ